MFEPFHEVVTNVSKTIQRYEAELDRPVIGVMPAYFTPDSLTKGENNGLRKFDCREKRSHPHYHAQSPPGQCLELGHDDRL